MNESNEQNRWAWMLLGFAFGIFGWLIAFATDNGDGRGKNALKGCLLWAVIVFFLFLI